ncbi:hypothetical protein HY995_04290 [Candidatus Micrarchaeota archaeon]|nr:hypothetical protein [Candidatus Micrarchaeota archaeon]MBI5177275.1 hypothetical protein [Candidatus Micrarchaeota archaeon]
MAYYFLPTPHFKKTLKRLDRQAQNKAYDRLAELGENPHAQGNPLRGQFEGIKLEDWRVPRNLPR